MYTKNDCLVLQRARVGSGGLEFFDRDGVSKAMALGAFLVEIPPHLDLTPGLRLCQNFYKSRKNSNDLYSGYRELRHGESRLGYEDRPNQVEQLQIESHLWCDYFPLEVVKVLEEIKLLTLVTLQCLFSASGVPKQHWKAITGSDDGAARLCYTTLNHYRSEKRNRLGIVEHTDSGFITMIYVDKPGFEIYENRQWMPIGNDSQFFIVNLGDAFEILTQDCHLPGAAVMHRVAETHPDPNGEDRSSFTVYMGPEFDMNLFRVTPDDELEVFQSFREFSVHKSKGMGYRFHPRVK